MTSISSPVVLKQRFIVLSPFLVLGLGQVAIRLFSSSWGGWGWAPFWVLYVLTLGVLISLHGGMQAAGRWLSPSKGHWGWPVLACVIPAAMTLPIFLPNWRLLLSPPILIWTLVFIAINPLLEEFYWRGTLLDATSAWPRGLSIFYTMLAFALHHLWIGVIASAGRHPSALAGPILMGTIWAITYKTTGSLRGPIVGHFLANLFSLSVPVFLNLYVPPGMPGR
jgi:membrane protease YdiL (CAAX protease family)